jgi:hypothetical protein
MDNILLFFIKGNPKLLCGLVAVEKKISKITSHKGERRKVVMTGIIRMGCGGV